MRYLLVVGFYLGWVRGWVRGNLRALTVLLVRRFCAHRDTEFMRNLWGDEILEWGYRRSLHRCCRCGQVVAKDYLWKGHD